MKKKIYSLLSILIAYQAPSISSDPFKKLNDTIKNSVTQLQQTVTKGTNAVENIAQQSALRIGKNTAILIENKSNKPTSFMVMVLHSTDQETELYNPQCKCYIGQTIISEPVEVKPGLSGVVTLDQEGTDLVNNSPRSIFGAVVVAIQQETKDDEYAGQITDVKVDPKAKVALVIRDPKTGSISKLRDVKRDLKTMVVFKDSNKLYFSTYTKKWVSDPRKKKLVFKSADRNNFVFPNHFVFDSESRENFNTPDYKHVIEQLRSAEEKMDGDKIFPTSYFNENNLKALPVEEVQNALSAAIMINNKPIEFKMASLSTLLDTGKYKYIAKIITEGILNIVLTIISGGAALSMFKDIVQQAVSSGIDLGKEISDLKQR